MDNFVFEQRKVIIFILFLLILGLGLAWIKKNVPVAADKVIFVDNSRVSNPVKTVKSFQPQQQIIISINTANEEELSKIPGIGPVFAKRVIEYREKNGLFQSKEDLLKIKGIGPKKFEKMKNSISL